MNGRVSVALGGTRARQAFPAPTVLGCHRMPRDAAQLRAVPERTVMTGEHVEHGREMFDRIAAAGFPGLGPAIVRPL
jgi:hypothetical protein